MRKLKKGFLNGFVEFTKETEIPNIFALWVAISSIGAVLGRNAVLDMAIFKIYANMYIVLVAGSARCRKSTSINLAEKYMRTIGTNESKVNILSQKMTTEALIEALATTEVSGSNIIKSAEGILVVDELGTFIDKNAFNSGLIQLLTDLYDCEDFEYRTRGRGKETIRNPCLSLLGGSTFHWIKESIPKVSIGGGFTSRIVFIYQESCSKCVPFPKMTDKMKQLRTDLIHDLGEIAKIFGEYHFSDKAQDAWGEEYKSFKTSHKFFDDPTLAGYAGRRHAILAKLCMIVAASYKDKLEINEEDFTIALDFLRLAEENMDKILQQINAEPIGDINKEVWDYLKQHKIVYRDQLIKKMSYKMTAGQVTTIIDGFLEYRKDDGSNIIKVSQDDQTGRIKYQFLGG
ncbi:MAG: DUF3987 domain-containing protein [Candidatus Heimdallarchaeota archaeon]